MAEKNRIRTKLFQLRLLDEEMEMLNEKSSNVGMSKTEYIRNLILFGYVKNNQKMDNESLQKFLYEMNRIGNNINQIAYNSNAKKSTGKDEIVSLVREFENLLELYQRFAFIEESD